MKTLKIAVPDHMRMFNRANFPHAMSKATIAFTLLFGGGLLSPLEAEARTGVNTDLITLALGVIAVLAAGVLLLTRPLVQKRRLEMAKAFTVKLREQGEVVVESVDRLAKMPATIRTENTATGRKTTWQASFHDPAVVLKASKKS